MAHREHLGEECSLFHATDRVEWMQVAQDGVQLADANYKESLNKPFYLAPANRVDLLVQAPIQEMSAKIRIQNVISRQSIDLTPSAEGTVLLAVEVGGRSVLRGDTSTQMPFLDKAPSFPKFIENDIEDELRENNYIKRKFVFESKPFSSSPQHTINGTQFNEGHAHVNLLMNSVEEWTIENKDCWREHDYWFCH